MLPWLVSHPAPHDPYAFVCQHLLAVHLHPTAYIAVVVGTRSEEESTALQLFMVLLSECLSTGVEEGLIQEELVEDCDASVMIALPRLAVLSGVMIRDGVFHYIYPYFEPLSCLTDEIQTLDSLLCGQPKEVVRELRVRLCDVCQDGSVALPTARGGLDLPSKADTGAADSSPPECQQLLDHDPPQQPEQQTPLLPSVPSLSATVLGAVSQYTEALAAAPPPRQQQQQQQKQSLERSSLRGRSRAGSTASSAPAHGQSDGGSASVDPALLSSLFIQVAKIADSLMTGAGATEMREVFKVVFTTYCSSGEAHASAAAGQNPHSRPQGQPVFELMPEWDVSSKSCVLCGVPFSLLRRRHHCRQCGAACCRSCSSGNGQPLPRFGVFTPVRVCRVCQAQPQQPL
jgi:hypothetical protein